MRGVLCPESIGHRGHVPSATDPSQEVPRWHSFRAAGARAIITLVDPSREFEDISDRMGQLMSMAFGDLALTPALSAPWTPLADITEIRDAYVVEAELPGVNKEPVPGCRAWPRF